MPKRPRRKGDEDTTVRLSFDRIEAGKGKAEIAVLLTDDGTPIDVPRGLLPCEARPGDVLAVTIRRDLEATQRVAKATRDVQDELKATDPGGDIHL